MIHEYRPIGSRFKYTQPRTISARIAIANEFISRTGYKLPTVVDPCYLEDPIVATPVSFTTNTTDSKHNNDLSCSSTSLVLPRSNPFEAIYAPWPIRFYLVSNNTLHHIAAPDQCSYDWTNIKQRLIDLIPST
jgi:hypothetical protein